MKRITTALCLQVHYDAITALWLKNPTSFEDFSANSALHIIFWYRKMLDVRWDYKRKGGHHVPTCCLIFSRGGARHFHLGRPLEGQVLQQGELSMACVGLSERDLKILGGPLGGRQNFWGELAPLPPLAAPLIVSEN